MEYKKLFKAINKEEQNFLKAPIYLYGTESIGAYYKALNLKGKSVLTVNGSGDQVLNAYFFGAGKVVGFDIVKNTHYMLNLKIAALKKLEYKEYLSFFGGKEGIGNLDYSTYNLLKEHLDKKTIKFFDKLYLQFKNKGTKLISSKNFRKRKEFYTKLDDINPFLANEKNYKKIKRVIKNVRPVFLESDIYEIHLKTNEKFDIINLSNVLNYVSRKLVKENNPNPLRHINQKIFLNLKKILCEKGKVIYYSFYRTSKEEDLIPLINQETSFKWLKEQKDFKVSKRNFKGILQGKDSITILEDIN